jgi:hypothetical protein
MDFGSQTRVLGLQNFCWHTATAGHSASALQPPHLPVPSQTPASHRVPFGAGEGWHCPLEISQ